MLSLGISIYIIFSVILGMYLTKKAKSERDFAVAGNSFPLPIATITVFATWFGAELIIGSPAAFLKHGFISITADPIAGSLCLVIIGMVLAKKLYNLSLISVGDFINKRFGKTAEIFVSLAIAASYFGWITGQFLAMGGIVYYVSGEKVSPHITIMISAFISILYNYKGGMFAVGINDFIHTIMIIIGLICILFIVLASADADIFSAIKYMISNNKFNFKYDHDYPNFLTVLTMCLTMILGTLPQQDIFQRIVSSKNQRVAQLSTIIGGGIYLCAAIIPLLIVAMIIKSASLTGYDPYSEMFMINYVLNKTPFLLQVLFLGGLLAAILSVISGTTLASSVILSHNILPSRFKKLSEIYTMKISMALIVISCASYAIFCNKNIHDVVLSSGACSMVIAFTPFIAGLFFPKASKAGCLASSFGGAIVWLLAYIFCNYYPAYNQVPASLYGLIGSIILMIIFSIIIPDKKAQKICS
jgi:solute:Na+ symporter, SSS family